MVTRSSAVPSVWRVVTSIGQREAPHQLRHPLLWLGAAVTVLQLALSAGEEDGSFFYIATTGWAFIPLGAGAFADLHTSVSRAERDNTVETLETLPTVAWKRTLGQLLAIGWLVLFAAALVAIAVTFGGPAEVTFGSESRAVIPSPVELAQGPLFVAFMGALGALAGRFVKTRFIAVPVVAALLPLMLVIGWSTGDGVAFRFLPLVDHKVSVGSIDTGTGWIDIVGHFETTAMSWHLLYLAGLTMTLGGWAVARDAVPRAVWAVVGTGAALAVIGGVGQAMV